MTQHSQRGVAMLMAMLTVSMVAVIATSAVMQQWKVTEVESAERNRLQAQWLLRGALDWSRLLLRQDGIGSADVDDLSEPWALPLQETRLSAFLAAHAGVTNVDASPDASDAYLSGGMQDLQAKMNLMNLVWDDAGIHARHVQRLFDRLGISRSEFELLRTGLLRANKGGAEGDAPLMPQVLADLQWLGIAPVSIGLLEPHATLLPVSSLVNINTASAVVLWASAEQLDWSLATGLVAARAGQRFRTLHDANEFLGANALSGAYFTTRSGYFQVQGRVRMESLVTVTQAQVQRTGVETKVLHVRNVSEAPTP